MLFNSVVTLKHVTISKDAVGNPTEVVTTSTAYANVFKVGTSAWIAAREAGLHADAEVEVRTCDYAGQERLVMNSVEYEIERAANNGEFTRLTLANRLNNG